MKKLLAAVTVLAVALLSRFALADGTYTGHLPQATRYRVCFTPGGDCTGLIVDTIDNAKKSILVQAYSFTAPAIAKALVNAKARGVDVSVILDKSDFQKRYTIATYLKNNHVPVWKDHLVAIAHNKAIVIDGAIVLTGSFNYTNAAQKHNAENLLEIDAPELAELYTKNWQKRLVVSEQM